MLRLIRIAISSVFNFIYIYTNKNWASNQVFTKLTSLHNISNISQSCSLFPFDASSAHFTDIMSEIHKL